MQPRSAIVLLNLAHAVDHMFLLIFATAVATIAADFGFARWEDLMPFGVDDHRRSRVAGLRLAVSLGISSLAVWLLGPLVKGMGFDQLLLVLGGMALCTASTVLWLPSEEAAPARMPA